MSKRRTKEKKLKANYSFLFRPKTAQSASGNNLVKSHLYQNREGKEQLARIKEKALNTELENDSISIKKDIVRSLSLTTLILGLEIVLYFVWNKL